MAGYNCRLMKRAILIGIGAIALVAFLGSAILGRMLGHGVLHPMLRPLTEDSILASEHVLQEFGAIPKTLIVTARDGELLRGWKISSKSQTGSWVLLFHGVSDNRTGMTGQAALLLRHGYSVVMMDARAHGESGGPMATYGRLERWDTRAVVDALVATDEPRNIFALGSSMGAAVALQSAGVEPRITAVVAESSFSDLREVTYDYAGLHWSPLLGKTFFRPGVWTVISTAQKEGGFSVDEVSPEQAVRSRSFPVLLICDGSDKIIPCRHTRRIFNAAAGPKEFWEVPGAIHASALGAEPAEYERRVITFLDRLSPTTSLPRN